MFKDYAEYYNAFYNDKDYIKEAKTVDYLLRKWGDNTHIIIDYGCGTGKHDIELTKLGYECQGIDLSQAMISIARENAKKTNLDMDFSVSDIRSFEPARKYDAVISLFHVISYQNTNEDVLAAFRSVRKALNTGGIFLFDAWFGPGVLSDKPSLRVKRVKSGDKQLVRIATPKMYPLQNIVDVNYEIIVFGEDDSHKIINEVHSMRYFFNPEIKLLLELSGFELLTCIDCDSLSDADYSSWTCYFVAKAC